MSWDVMIFRFDSPPPPISKWPDNFRPVALGEAQEIRNKISHDFPNIDWSDPAWGIFDGKGYSIEFNLQKEGVVEGFMLHVRGGGDPLPTICKLCLIHGWYAFDCSTGYFIDLDHPSREGWTSFQQFRDKVISKSNNV